MTLDPLLFAPAFSDRLGSEVATAMGLELSGIEEREFEAGEHKTRPLVNVRARDTYVIASLAGDSSMSANDKLVRLLFFTGALRQAAARSVTAVVPYLCYSRKDRQTKARDPVTTRYVAQLFEAVGVDRVVTLDVHNLAAFQNAFRCPTEHLEATDLFVDHARRTCGNDDIVVVSPDIGGVKRAERFRQRLSDELGADIDLAFTGKHRSRGVVSGPEHVLGDVEGRHALVIDDIISSGGTMLRVASMLRDQGAAHVQLLATHGLFTPAATSLFDTPLVDTVVVTDSVDQCQTAVPAAGDRTVLECSPLLGAAITGIHGGGSVSDLIHMET